MQQFTVPQFIDVEDKIIGPVTARQFIIMLTGFMIMAICYRIFDFSLFLFSSIIIFAVSGIIAFFKVNGMPFHFFMLNFTQTFKRPKLRVWNCSLEEIKEYYEGETSKKKEEGPIVPQKIFDKSRLSELALMVDTQGVYKGDEKGKSISEF